MFSVKTVLIVTTRHFMTQLLTLFQQHKQPIAKKRHYVNTTDVSPATVETGGSAHVTSLLPQRRLEAVFTDVSPAAAWTGGSVHVTSLLPRRRLEAVFT